MGKVELTFEVDSEVVERASKSGLDLAGIAREAVEAAVARQDSPEERARQWREENAEAIEAHREWIATYGAFAEDLRTW